MCVQVKSTTQNFTSNNKVKHYIKNYPSIKLSTLSIPNVLGILSSHTATQRTTSILQHSYIRGISLDWIVLICLYGTYHLP
ncbi:hypothetical protein BDV23DRAFT_61104 [Aspergillus alliaceus]|uniref:Uncharacterized protein n=1 Tax=Petromyces alliaceus TaxID=209559 RepID=A0A5N7CD78_PETAA|nr:hypothetical protein BDV23DRAFT_61104 [Aspergillus alliaceus]